MTAAVPPPLPPLAGPVGRRLLASLGPQQTTTELDLIAPAFLAAHHAEIGPDDRIEVTRRGSVHGRPLDGADPVLGGRGPAVPPPFTGDRSGSLLDRFRRRPQDGTLIAEQAVRAAATDARVVSSHESPDWPQVVAELRRMAGAGPAAPDDETDTGTGWLRRRAHTNNP